VALTRAAASVIVSDREVADRLGGPEECREIGLAVHTPWTLAADAETVPERVQLQHPTRGTPDQRDD